MEFCLTLTDLYPVTQIFIVTDEFGYKSFMPHAEFTNDEGYVDYSGTPDSPSYATYEDYKDFNLGEEYEQKFFQNEDYFRIYNSSKIEFLVYEFEDDIKKISEKLNVALKKSFVKYERQRIQQLAIIETLSEYIIWEVPIEFKIAFHQYLTYFNRYVEKTKGKKVNVQIVDTENGVKIIHDENSRTPFDKVKLWLQEYVYLTLEKEANYKIHFDSQLTEIELNHFVVELNSQVKHLKKSLEIVNTELKQIESKNEYLKELNNKLILQLSAPKQKEENIYVEIKNLVGHGDTKKAFDIFLNYIPHEMENIYNESVALFGRYNRVAIEMRSGRIENEKGWIEINNINHSLLVLVDELNEKKK